MTERELFEAALDKTPAERAAFLDRACAGAPALRQRLEALLARQEQAGSFLEGAALEGISAAAERPRGASSLSEAPGEVLAGRYQLLEQIGEGGMGTVWLAQRPSRSVAGSPSSSSRRVWTRAWSCPASRPSARPWP